jgi:hypothetical protein
MKTNIICSVELANLTLSETGFPTIEVRVINPDGLTVLTRGWLMPFRGYCFQVSGTREGEWDLGASPALSPFREMLFNVPDDESGTVKKTLLKGQAIIALHRFLQRDSDHHVAKGQHVVVDQSNLDVQRTWGHKEPLPLDKFIDACYEWIFRT